MLIIKGVNYLSSKLYARILTLHPGCFIFCVGVVSVNSNSDGELRKLSFYVNSDSDGGKDTTQKSSSGGRPLLEQWRTAIHFWCLAALLSQVGPRVSSLIILEFCLRGVSAGITAGQVRSTD